MLQAQQMAQFHTQMVQHISQWQLLTVTQGIRFRHQQHAHAKLTKHGVMRLLPAT